ncbi:MAG: UvrD-helicase domain-containing protein [Bacteroidales bacterium]|nr:UvrD-helicase domain-containing protein [Bacteroidales bacterium]
MYRQIKDRIPNSIPYGKKTKIIDEIKFDFINTLAFDFQSNNIFYKTDISKSKLLAKNSETDRYKFIQSIKFPVLEEGYLFYRDAYSLALWYIEEYKEQLRKSFSQRFKYVFVDEMQDTDQHQLAIIKGLFDKTDTIIQYFGDPNQAIFNYVKEGMVWKPEENGRIRLNISDSKRFGNNIANLLDKIKVDDNIELKGNEEVKSLKPLLILFKTGEEEKVLKKFAEIIAENKEVWKLDLEKQNKEPVYKAVGWVAKERTKQEIADNKLNIKSYFKDFEKKTNKHKQTFDNLKYYLRKNDHADKNGVKIYYDLIISAFLQILEIAGVKNEIEIIKNGKTETQKRLFTKSSLLKYLKTKGKYNEFRKNIAVWSSEIHSNNELYNYGTIEKVRKYFYSINKNIPDKVQDLLMNLYIK